MIAGTGGRAPARKVPSELRLRVLSALFLVPLALAVTYLGDLWFVLGASACALLLLREWTVIVGATRSGSGLVFAFAAAVVALLAAALGHIAIAFALLGCGAAAIFAFGMLRSDEPVRWLAGGLVYAGAAGIVLIAFRAGEAGFSTILFLFGIVWATDIAAYFVGRALGGPKLWRRVSPKKTWSGALGGLAAALGVGAAAALVTGVAGLAGWLIAAAVLSVFSQAGDLLESALKRHFGVKDSGRLIPGHGGVMDRLDGVVGAGVLGYLVAVVVSGVIGDPVGGLVTMQGY